MDAGSSPRSRTRALYSWASRISGHAWGRALQGIGAGHGHGRGRACTTADPGILPNLKPGDILVAVNAGPMWTPLFSILGGLVLEKGSVGQHAATTAREYGVPVAIQVKGACHLIADGRRITVDGESGAVELAD